MEVVLVALPGVVVVALVARWGQRRCAERARLARIRRRIGEWLTPEWAGDLGDGSGSDEEGRGEEGRQGRSA
ncbi:hypothetical protein ACFFQW_08155 [Umezawaea endophytica]|uniref:Uncharacterized protein n=1 Tax=Umezawaea endophytica TaxID=1654476 RepID=A0A9X2VG21_9PSEU|nr:hypothetical protein [Umezawaea endophytica]MCS7475956.1 hypothetical protein [Umezawaea endophytica]